MSLAVSISLKLFDLLGLFIMVSTSYLPEQVGGTSLFEGLPTPESSGGLKLSTGASRGSLCLCNSHAPESSGGFMVKHPAVKYLYLFSIMNS